MVNKGKNEQSAHTGLGKPSMGIQGIGGRIAPAVALLLLGDAAYAGDSIPVPEPSILGLVTAGTAVSGVMAFIRSKRRK